METNYYTKTIKHSLAKKEVISTSFLLPYSIAVEHNPAIDIAQYYNFNNENDNYVKPQYLLNPRGEKLITEFIYNDNNILIGYSCEVLRDLFILMRDNDWDNFCESVNLSIDKEKIAQLVKGLDKRDKDAYNTVSDFLKDAFRFYGCLDTVVYNAEKEAVRVFVTDQNDELQLQEAEKHCYLYHLDGMTFDHGYNLSDYSLIANVYPYFATPSVIARQVEELSYGSIPVEINSIADQKQQHLLALSKFLTDEDYQYINENTGADDRFYLSIEWDADGKIHDIIYHTIPIYRFASS